MQTHLKGFGLENFRVFKEYTWFDFAPITILTGPNSSGKSSLNKALILMKDNITGTREFFSNEVKHSIGNHFNLSFDGSTHNLSSGKNSINKDSDNAFISFYFKNEISFLDIPIFKKLNFLIKDKAVQIEMDKSKLMEIFKRSNSIELTDSKNQPIIRVSSGNNPSFYCDLVMMTRIASQFLEKLEIFIALEMSSYESYSRQYDSVHPGHEYLVKVKQCLEEFISNFSNINFNEYQVDLIDFYNKNGPFFQENIFGDNLLGDLQYFDSPVSQDSFLSLFSQKIETQFGFLLINNGYSSGLEKDNINKLFPENSKLSILIKSFISTLGILAGTFDATQDIAKAAQILLPYLGDLHYLPSIKGFNERSFRSKDEHVLNVLFKEYIKNYELDSTIGVEDTRRIFFEKWFAAFGLENMKMERDDKLDSNFYTANGFSNVDIGYGLTQIIAVILRILSVADSVKDQEPFANPVIIILEEPEANLHPKYQSILADLICEAARNFQIQFIVETHSEYLIRKLQFLTAKEQVKPDDSVIYYFNDPNNIPNGEKQVKKIEILEDGSLSDDFGPGFFDEAANWELELIRLKNSKNRNN